MRQHVNAMQDRFEKFERFLDKNSWGRNHRELIRPKLDSSALEELTNVWDRSIIF